MAATKPQKDDKKTRQILHYFDLANKKYESGDYKKVVKICQKALSEHPGLATIQVLLGRAYINLNKNEEAIEVLEDALANHNRPETVHLPLGLAYANVDRVDEALPLLTSATEQQPNNLQGWHALAVTLFKLFRPVEAEQAFLRALSVARATGRNAAPVYAIYGAMLNELGRYEESLVVCRQGMELQPDHSAACYNAYFAARQLGLMVEAMSLFEIGFSTGNREPWRIFNNIPRWRGEDLTDKRLLIWREQGIGDEVLYAGLYNWAIAQAGSVRIETQPRLLSLFQRSFPDAEVVLQDGADDRTRTDCDFEVPAASIPEAVGDNDRIRDLYGAAAPWIVPDPERVETWSDHLRDLPPGLRVGICWRSMQSGVLRNRHYYDLVKHGRTLLQTPGVTWVNLQYDNCAEELAAAQELFGVTVHQVPGVDMKDDLEDVVAIMRGLDLVITVGTAVDWFATSVGTPVWAMWRGCREPNSPPRRNTFSPPNRLLWEVHWTEDWPQILNRVAGTLAKTARDISAASGAPALAGDSA